MGFDYTYKSLQTAASGTPLAEKGVGAHTIMKLVALAEDWGDLKDNRSARTLRTHLTTLEHFERKEDTAKVSST